MFTFLKVTCEQASFRFLRQNGNFCTKTHKKNREYKNAEFDGKISTCKFFYNSTSNCSAKFILLAPLRFESLSVVAMSVFICKNSISQRLMFVV